MPDKDPWMGIGDHCPELQQYWMDSVWAPSSFMEIHSAGSVKTSWQTNKLTNQHTNRVENVTSLVEDKNSYCKFIHNSTSFYFSTACNYIFVWTLNIKGGWSKGHFVLENGRPQIRHYIIVSSSSHILFNISIVCNNKIFGSVSTNVLILAIAANCSWFRGFAAASGLMITWGKPSTRSWDTCSHWNLYCNTYILIHWYYCSYTLWPSVSVMSTVGVSYFPATGLWEQAHAQRRGGGG